MGLAASRQEAFWEACGFGHLERAKHFLQEGDIDVNWVSYTNDCCPIHVASQGKPDIVQLLLEHKCDVNVRDNRENLAVHHAAMKGHVDIVQTLLDAGSEIDAQEKNGWTALHNAAYWCRPRVVQVLLKNGCDVHKLNKDERTALQECARSQQKDEVQLGEIARMLIEAGSDINSKSSDWGEADLTCLMYASFHNHPEVATVLIEAGCELNSVGTTFWSALHWAADRGNDELVYILLEAGIDPTIRDMKGDTALDRAKSDDMKSTLKTAIDLHKEVNRATTIPILQARPVPAPVFKPSCDANFKSQSFLPKDWKPANSVNIKNLINEKKSKLAAMTSEKYRTELARRTGTKVIQDHKKKETDQKEENDNVGESDQKGESDKMEKSNKMVESGNGEESKKMGESDNAKEMDQHNSGSARTDHTNPGSEKTNLGDLKMENASEQTVEEKESKRSTTEEQTKNLEEGLINLREGELTIPDAETNVNVNDCQLVTEVEVDDACLATTEENNSHQDGHDNTNDDLENKVL